MEIAKRSMFAFHNSLYRSIFALAMYDFEKHTLPMLRLYHVHPMILFAVLKFVKSPYTLQDG